MTLRIFRIRSHTHGPFAGRDEAYHPHADKAGNYALGPRPRSDRHHVVARKSTPSLAEVARLLRAGDHCLRMRGELTGQVSMIAPDKITIEE